MKIRKTKNNVNTERDISWESFPMHARDLRKKVQSIHFTVESIADLAKIRRLFEGKPIERWEMGGGDVATGREVPALVLEFKLKRKEIDQVFQWLEKDKPEIGWSFWEKGGDPLIYFKRRKKQLCRYYWLGQKIPKTPKK